MADEILLKARKVEQQVNITISGENKLYDIADTINCMLNGRNLQDYWKSKQQLFIDLVQAKADYCSNQTEINAKRFIKIANAYKAMTNPAFGKLEQEFEETIQDAKKLIRCPESLDSFSIMCFKKAFSSFEVLQAYGTNVDKFFELFK